MFYLLWNYNKYFWIKLTKMIKYNLMIKNNKIQNKKT